jgi:hypothetical protein
MPRRHQIFSEQIQNGDLNEDEVLLVSDELFKCGWAEEIATPTGNVRDKLGAESEDVVRTGVETEDAADVTPLLALVERMGGAAAERGTTC